MSQLSIQSQMNEMRLRDQRSSERIQLREGSASAQSTPWTISCPDPGQSWDSPAGGCLGFYAQTAACRTVGICL